MMVLVTEAGTLKSILLEDLVNEQYLVGGHSDRQARSDPVVFEESDAFAPNGSALSVHCAFGPSAPTARYSAFGLVSVGTQVAAEKRDDSAGGFAVSVLETIAVGLEPRAI